MRRKNAHIEHSEWPTDETSQVSPKRKRKEVKQVKEITDCTHCQGENTAFPELPEGYEYVTCSCSDTSRAYTKPKRRVKKFRVRLGSKRGNRLAKYNKGKYTIYINDRNGPIIYMKRGYTYFFQVDAEGHAFYLTNNPIGGRHDKLEGSFDPVSRDVVTFQPTTKTPKHFFYQCACHPYEGGIVLITDDLTPGPSGAC